MDPRKHNILIVDDEEHNLDTLRRTFRNKYNVFAACSGEEGLCILRDREIALVVTDQKMPGITGTEFLQQVSVYHPRTIRIVLTGYSDEKSIQAALENGFIHHYLTKPWSTHELQTAVKKALEAYKNNSWKDT